MSGLISVDEAYHRLESALPERRIETRPLAACLGLQLARDLPAKVSRPPADVSAMDGYGVRLADVSKAGAALTVIPIHMIGQTGNERWVMHRHNGGI